MAVAPVSPSWLRNNQQLQCSTSPVASGTRLNYSLVLVLISQTDPQSDVVLHIFPSRPVVGEVLNFTVFS